MKVALKQVRMMRRLVVIFSLRFGKDHGLGSILQKSNLEHERCVYFVQI